MTGPEDDETLDREIEEALEGRSVLDIARSELLGKRAGAKPAEVTRGWREGTVAGVGRDDVFVAFGPREQGVVPLEHFGAEPEVGSPVRVFVERFDPKESLWLCSLRRGPEAADWESVEPGAVLRGVVRAANAGGLELQCGTMTAFLPASHVSLERVDDLEALIGQTFDVEVIEADRERRRLVVSRRGILARERDAAREQAVETLTPGTTVKGTVTRVERYGAFVDVGGTEGLLHVSEMAWKRVEDPSTQVSVGDVLEVQVLEVTEGGRRISLSRKALEEDPFDRFAREHPAGSVLEGRVTRLASFGAFVEVAEGVEGLLHVSAMAPGGVRSPREVVAAGQTVGVRVTQVEPERRRVGLSLLSERGDRLTDDVADDATVREVLERTNRDVREPTLGDLLHKALGQRPPEEDAGDDAAH